MLIMLNRSAAAMKRVFDFDSALYLLDGQKPQKPSWKVHMQSIASKVEVNLTHLL